MNDWNELLSLIEPIPEPRILVARDYRILGANRAYLRAFDQSQSPVGAYCYEVSHHYAAPCDQCGESCPLQTALQTGQPARALHLHHTARGEEHVEVELTPIRDASGVVVGFVEGMRLLRAVSEDAGMIGHAPAFNRALALIARAAPAMTPVLLLGESGTGKELAALALHRLSSRHDRPFVPVECSGLTESLFESELFGYEKGAFTGANQRKFGLVEAAAGGTLFLDEVGDIPLAMQVKLLRLLESRSFRRVGGVESLAADFRLVAATHRDLQAMVEAGSFRRDLYYRLAVFPVELPALRERHEDLPQLCEKLLQRVAPGRALRLDASAFQRLSGYTFPGNIRELRNLLERASLLADGEVILAAHLPDLTSDPAAIAPPVASRRSLAMAEDAVVQETLAFYGGDRAQAAQALGVSERTLYRKLARARQVSYSRG
jgi:DNA-binding NtrC family response regulator